MGTWERRVTGGAMVIFGVLQLAVAVTIPFLRYAEPIKTATLVEIATAVGLFGVAFVLGGYAMFVRLRLKN